MEAAFRKNRQDAMIKKNPLALAFWNDVSFGAEIASSGLLTVSTKKKDELPEGERIIAEILDDHAGLIDNQIKHNARLKELQGLLRQNDTGSRILEETANLLKQGKFDDPLFKRYVKMGKFCDPEFLALGAAAVAAAYRKIYPLIKSKVG